MVTIHDNPISKIGLMSLKSLLLVALLLPLVCKAAGGDECINSKIGDERELCIAKTRVNAGNCENIVNMGIRSDCLSIVKNKQRQLVWAIKPMSAETVHIRSESSKAFNWMR
jgi:hypothetical protein